MARELQTLNEQKKLALWAERVNACRSSGRTVKDWCKERGVCEQTYYRWQKRLFEMARQQQEGRFAEITPERMDRVACGWNNSNGSGCWCRGGYSFRCGCSHRGNGTTGKVIPAIIFFRLALSTAALATSPWDDLTARIILPTIAAVWRSCIIDNGLDYTGYTVLLSICAENQKE